MLLAKIIAVAYVLFGLFGLLVISIPDNQRDMFLEPGRPLVGIFRLLHAYGTVLTVIACGVAVWLWPTSAVIRPQIS